MHTILEILLPNKQSDIHTEEIKECSTSAKDETRATKKDELYLSITFLFYFFNEYGLGPGNMLSEHSTIRGSIFF